MMQTGHASLYLRKGKILVVAWSSIASGATIADYNAYCALFSSAVGDDELGAHVRRALLASRANQPYDSSDRSGSGKFAAAFGLKSYSTANQGLKSASVSWSEGQIIMRPMRRRFGGHADYFPKDDLEHGRVVCAFDCVDKVVGAAARECLSRCL